MHSFYLDAIRNFEGYSPAAQWDYAQHSNGYGTRARFPGEVIDRAEAERRFQSEVAVARSVVEKAVPHVDEGTKAALTSLTYNAGTAWVDSGLGDAVRRGDIEATREIFQKYNKAGGEVLPGLVSRRSQEALWIGNPDALAGTAGIGNTAATMPPVLVDRTPAVTSATDGSKPLQVASAASPVFSRPPRAEHLRLAGPLSMVADETLAALIESGGLSGGGVAEIARLAQLGRGSELVNRDRERENETRRV
jgi:lysozyme